MRQKAFAELLESVKQAGAISRGEQAPGRVTSMTTDGVVEALDPKKFQQRQKLLQSARARQCASCNRLGAMRRRWNETLAVVQRVCRWCGAHD